MWVPIDSMQASMEVCGWADAFAWHVVVKYAGQCATKQGCLWLISINTKYSSTVLQGPPNAVQTHLQQLYYQQTFFSYHYMGLCSYYSYLNG
uniref:Uncharacterized protein n=1 Tax=Arundo donax TaxID=35708 RepID=A0A0A9C684_ARUDO